MKTGILTLIMALTVSIQLAYSQTTQDQAKAYYFEATTAYDSKNYNKTLEFCTKVVEALGTSNARIESLRIKSYFELNQIERARQALDSFYNLRAEEKLKQEILPYIVKIEKKENEIEIEKQRITHAKLKAEKEYDQNIKEALKARQESKWSTALSYYTDAKGIKNSTWLEEQIKEVKTQLANQNLELVNQDISSKNWEAAYHKLNEIVQVINTQEVQTKLNLVNDELSYKKAIQNKDPNRIKGYLTSFPNGVQRTNAEKYLFTYYLEKANTSFKNKQIDEHFKYLEEIKMMEKSSNWNKYSTSYYSELKQMGKHLSTGNKTHQEKNLNTAIKYYELLSTKPGEKESEKTLKQLKNKQKEWNRPNIFQIGFISDNKLNDIGITLGGLSNRSVSFMFALQGAMEIAKETEGPDNSFKTKGRDHLSYRAEIQLNKKIIYPLWIYAGSGWTRIEKIIELSEDPKMGYISDPKLELNTASMLAGINLFLNPIVLTIGASTPYLTKTQKEEFSFTKAPIYFNIGIGYGGK